MLPWMNSFIQGVVTLLYCPAVFFVLFWSSCSLTLFSSFTCTLLFLQPLCFSFSSLHDPLISLCCSSCMLCDRLLPIPNKEAAAHQPTLFNSTLSLFYYLGSTGSNVWLECTNTHKICMETCTQKHLKL